MADIVNSIVSKYRADTSDAVSAVKRLRGVERDEAKKTLEALNAHNAGLERQIATIAKVTAAVGATAGAVKLAQVAYKSYVEDVRLESAAAGVNIDRLKEATRGLVDEDRLLAFAGKAQHGVWKLNEQQMATVLQGAVALRKTMGVELQPTIEKLTEAVAKGSTRAFKEYGIEASNVSEAMDGMRKVIAQAGDDISMQGDQIARTGVKIEDAMDNIAGGVGRMVAELEPAISAVGTLVDGLSRLGDTRLSGQSAKVQLQLQIMDREKKGDAQSLYEAGILREQLVGLMIKEANARDGVRSAVEESVAQLDYVNKWLNEQAKLIVTKIPKVVAASQGRRGGGGGGGPYAEGLTDAELAYGRAGAIGASLAAGQDAAFRAGGGRTLGEGGTAAIAESVRLTTIQSDARAGAAAIQELATAWEASEGAAKAAADQAERMKELAAAERASIFEQIFGRPEQIDATSMAITAASQAVDVFANSTAAAYEAMVLGSGSAIDAAKKVAAGAIHSIGQELAVVGAKEAILSLVSLATGNFPGAGLHAGASAAAFAGSAVAFKTAQAMGYGAGGTSAASGIGQRGGSASAGAASSRGGDGGGVHNTYVVGADWYGLTRSEREALLARAVKKGQRNRSSNVIQHN